MKKRLLSVVLVLCMVMAILPVAAFAKNDASAAAAGDAGKWLVSKKTTTDNYGEETIAYQYDDSGRLLKETVTRKGTEYNLIKDYIYDDEQHTLKIQYSNYFHEEWECDENMRPIKGETHAPGEVGYWTKQYDSQGRLIKAVERGMGEDAVLSDPTTYEYSYDSNGNLIRVDTIVNTPYGLLPMNRTEYQIESYDQNGNAVRIRFDDTEYGAGYILLEYVYIAPKVAPPQIVSNPQDYIGASGDTASFTVTASGEDLHYSWQYSDDDGATWNNGTAYDYPSASCIINNVTDGRLYRCLVYNSAGVVESSSARIILNSNYFVIGRDNNHFSHNVQHFFNYVSFARSTDQNWNQALEKYQKEGDERKSYKEHIKNNYGEYDLITFCYDGDGANYRTKYLSLFRGSLFTSEFSQASYEKILKEANKHWDGACNGMAVTMALASSDCLSDVFGNTSFFNLGEPKDNQNNLRDVIHYFHLLQYSYCFNADHQTFKDQAMNIVMGGDSNSDFLKNLVNEAIKSQNQRKPFIMTYLYSEGGHALVVCGYEGTDKNGTHRIKVYDCNYESDYLYIDISNDYSSFHFVDGNNKRISSAWNNMSFYSYDTISSAANYFSKGIKQTKNASVLSSMENTKAMISIPAAEKFILKNAEGEILKSDGKTISGTMNVELINVAGSDHNVQFLLLVNPSTSFTVTDFDNDFEMDLSQNTFSSAKVSGASSVVFENDDININGSNYAFEAMTGSSLSSVDIVSFSGNADGAVHVSAQPEKAEMLAQKSNTISISTYKDGAINKTTLQQDADRVAVQDTAANQYQILIDGTPYKQLEIFHDVPSSSYYYDAVAWAVNHVPQITNGTGDNTFSPEWECQRCQIVTFLWRAMGCPEPTSTRNPFVDVKPSDYFYKPVLWAVEKGVTNGMDLTHFDPTSTCTRGQAVTFLWRAEGRPAPRTQVSEFTDVQNPNDYFYTPVLWAVENGITNGTGNGLFSPNMICLREQIVTFLYRDLA